MVWGLCSCSDSETTEREEVIGYLGRANKNPYLAAERYLESDHHDVTSTTGVLKFDDNEGLVLSPSSSVRSIGDAQRVLNWVDEGGHYVCFLERGEDFWKDLGDHADHWPDKWRDSERETEQLGLELILDSLDIELTEQTDAEFDWDVRDPLITRGEQLPHSELRTVVVDESREFDLQLGGTRELVSVDGIPYEGDWVDLGESHRFFSRLYGGGRITLISDGRVFRNPYLQLAEHAETLDFLASGGGKVVFSLGKVRSFTSMLAEYAWMAMWPLLVLTVLWIWKSLPRFGPLLEVTEGDARNYAKQIKNTGQFLWRHMRDDTLLQSLRNAVVLKSGHYHDQGASSKVLIEQLSQSSGLDLELVSEAMTRTEVRDANTMVKISKTLQQILKSL